MEIRACSITARICLVQKPEESPHLLQLAPTELLHQRILDLAETNKQRTQSEQAAGVLLYCYQKLCALHL